MANTPFLDLVKPAGTDRALVSVINSNSDKIDGGVSTLSEQLGINLGEKSGANLEAFVAAAAQAYLALNIKDTPRNVRVVWTNHDNYQGTMLATNNWVKFSLSTTSDLIYGNYAVSGGVVTVSQIATYNCGSKTVQEFVTAIEQLGSAMANGDVKNIYVQISSASAPFEQATYTGTIRRNYSDRYDVILFTNASTKTIVGAKSSSGWAWQQLATTTPSSITLTTESDVTINKGGAYRVGGLVVVQLNVTLSANKNGGLINGLPAPMNAGTVTVVSLAGGGSVNAAGQIRGTLNAGTYIFTGAYVPAS